MSALAASQDGLRGAVVLLHHEDRGVGVVVLEVEQVLDRGPAPRVHALVGVAHHAQVPVLGGEQVHQVVLGAVRVLVLVDQDVPEPLLVVLEDLGVLAEQPDGLHDDVVEVERPGRAQAPLVLGVDLADRLLEVRVRGLLGVLAGADEVVLGLADHRGRSAGPGTASDRGPCRFSTMAMTRSVSPSS